MCTSCQYLAQIILIYLNDPDFVKNFSPKNICPRFVDEIAKLPSRESVLKRKREITLLNRGENGQKKKKTGP